MLPLAHLGHYVVWAAYALPVLLVIAGIAYSTIAGNRRQRQEERRSPSGEDAPPGG